MYNFLHPELGKCVPNCSIYDGYKNPSSGSTCECEVGYSLDSDNHCQSCWQLVSYNCFACSSIDNGVTHTCDVCDDENWIFTPDNSDCQPKILNCNVHTQPN